MAQESNTFGICDYGTSKFESCVTQCLSSRGESSSSSTISIGELEEEKMEEELKRRKREELIQYYIQQHEAFLKNPNVCVDAIDHYYYLVPRDKRSKRKSTLRNEHVIKRENKKIKMAFKEKPKKRLMTSTKRVKSEAILPVELKNKIQEMGVPISEVSLVIEKPLYTTDLSKKHMRLSIPARQVINEEFLTPEEKEILETKDDYCNKKSKIEFSLIEPSLEESNIYLAKWTMNSSSCYVLLNDWISEIIYGGVIVVV